MSEMNQAFVRGFDVWENEFREHPEKFLTVEQMAAMETQTLSEQRATFFEAILDRLADGRPWNTIGAEG